MPRLKLSVLVAVLWLVRGASPSHAIDVFWELENLSSFETGTTIVAANDDLVRASIYLDSSVDGVTGYSFSLLWDETLDDELALVSFASTPPPPLTEFVVPSQQESSHVVPGQISSFNGFSLGFPAVPFFGVHQVGEVVLRVEKVSPDGVDLRLAVIPAAGDAFQDAALQLVTVTLPDATIDGQADCDDAQDNDGDGLTDFGPGRDPGCTGFFDGWEKEIGIVCDDGEDNDGDGLIDFPEDPGCASPAATSEDAPPPDVPAVGGLGMLALALVLGLAGSVAARRRAAA